MAEAAMESGLWDAIEFLDDNLVGSQVLGLPVIATAGDVADYLDKTTEFIVAIGDNARRLALLNQVVNQGGSQATVIHPTAWISPSAVIEPGTVGFAGVVLHARSRIGSGAILNTGATVDHDCVIGDGAHVSPGANLAGSVCVGDRSWVGIGASVKEGITIGRDVVVGAGAAVVSDIADGEMVGGVPARTLTTRNSDD